MAGEKTYPEERLVRIMEIIKQHRSVTVDELAGLFGMTGATIRADLRTLESRGLVTRTHGGALLRELADPTFQLDRDPVYQSRLNRMAPEKEAIGIACAQYIAKEDCVMLDDGSTTLYVAKHFDSQRGATVITNGLTICNELVSHPNCKVICTGGCLVPGDLAFNGRTAEDTVRKFHTSCTVLGASGLTLTEGLTAPDEERAELKKCMIDSSVKTIIVADHTKLSRVSMVPVCEIGFIDVLVTDWGAAEEQLEGYRALGIHVIVAKP